MPGPLLGELWARRPRRARGELGHAAHQGRINRGGRGWATRGRAGPPRRLAASRHAGRRVPPRRDATPGDEGEKVGAGGLGEERMNASWCRCGRSWGSKERGWARERDGRATTGWLGARWLGFRGGCASVEWARWAARGNGLGGKARCARWATGGGGVGVVVPPFYLFFFSLSISFQLEHNSNSQ
jgi:hypothetical protein